MEAYDIASLIKAAKTAYQGYDFSYTYGENTKQVVIASEWEDHEVIEVRRSSPRNIKWVTIPQELVTKTRNKTQRLTYSTITTPPRPKLVHVLYSSGLEELRLVFPVVGRLNPLQLAAQQQVLDRDGLRRLQVPASLQGRLFATLNPEELHSVILLAHHYLRTVELYAPTALYKLVRESKRQPKTMRRHNFVSRVSDDRLLTVYNCAAQVAKAAVSQEIANEQLGEWSIGLVGKAVHFWTVKPNTWYAVGGALTKAQPKVWRITPGIADFQAVSAQFAQDTLEPACGLVSARVGTTPTIFKIDYQNGTRVVGFRPFAYASESADHQNNVEAQVQKWRQVARGVRPQNNDRPQQRTVKANEPYLLAGGVDNFMPRITCWTKYAATPQPAALTLTPDTTEPSVTWLWVTVDQDMFFKVTWPNETPQLLLLKPSSVVSSAELEQQALKVVQTARLLAVVTVKHRAKIVLFGGQCPYDAYKFAQALLGYYSPKQAVQHAQQDSTALLGHIPPKYHADIVASAIRLLEENLVQKPELDSSTTFVQQWRKK